MRKKQIILAGLWMLLLLALWICTGSFAGFSLVVISLFLFLADGFYVLVAREKLATGLECSQAVEKQEKIRGKLLLKNHSFLPLPSIKGYLKYQNLLTGETGRMRFQTGIPAYGAEELTWEIKSRYCGKLHIMLEQVENQGFLGVFGWKEKKKTECACVVLPKLFHIEAELTEGFVLNQESVRYSGTRRGEDPGEIYGLREYLPGDSLKHIHWKLTGKMGEWYIKELGMPIENSILLLYESAKSQDGPEISDARMETLFSLSKALLTQDYAHQIGWYSPKDGRLRFCVVNTQEELAELTFGLLELGMVEEHTSALKCYLEETVSHPFSHVVYLTSQADEKAIDQLKTQCEVRVLQCIEEKEQTGQSKEICFSSENKEEALCQVFI